MPKIFYTPAERNFLKKFNSPKKIQDLINSLEFNFEKSGETCYSPRFALKYRQAHCMEGAMLAAALLEFHGAEPLVLDLRSASGDFDHVVAIFKKFGCFGAISKTNHAVMRYREPVYRTLRELALSYFHEYFLNNGQKTLREYSATFNLNYFNKLDWRTSAENLFEIPNHLDDIKHFSILSSAQFKNLRLADDIEVQAGKLVECKK